MNLPRRYEWTFDWESMVHMHPMLFLRYRTATRSRELLFSRLAAWTSHSRGRTALNEGPPRQCSNTSQPNFPTTWKMRVEDDVFATVTWVPCAKLHPHASPSNNTRHAARNDSRLVGDIPSLPRFARIAGGEPKTFVDEPHATKEMRR